MKAQEFVQWDDKSYSRFYADDLRLYGHAISKKLLCSNWIIFTVWLFRIGVFKKIAVYI